MANILDVMLPETAYLIDELVEMSGQTLPQVKLQLQEGLLKLKISKAIIYDIGFWWRSGWVTSETNEESG